jgi:hypothetical protein
VPMSGLPGGRNDGWWGETGWRAIDRESAAAKTNP